VTVRGTVIRAAAVRPLVTALPYTCERCGARQLVRFPDGVVAPPSRCAAEACKSQRFTPDLEGALAEDVQRLKLQELPRADAPAGVANADHRANADDAEHLQAEDDARVPRTLEVELAAGLCACAAAGDEVTVCGIVKARACTPCMCVFPMRFVF
jgi:DNA replicative helicase MCM subunit Mcm2 (Cdc46/Mcm family)